MKPATSSKASPVANLDLAAMARLEVQQHLAARNQAFLRGQLETAIRLDQTDSVQDILSQPLCNPDLPNAQGETALYQAIMADHPRCVRLLAHDHRVNLGCGMFPQRGYLNLCVTLGRPDCLRALFTTTDSQRLALLTGLKGAFEHALESGQPEFLEILSAGSRPDNEDALRHLMILLNPPGPLSHEWDARMNGVFQAHLDRLHFDRDPALQEEVVKRVLFNRHEWAASVHDRPGCPPAVKERLADRRNCYVEFKANHGAQEGRPDKDLYGAFNQWLADREHRLFFPNRQTDGQIQ